MHVTSIFTPTKILQQSLTPQNPCSRDTCTIVFSEAVRVNTQRLPNMVLGAGLMLVYCLDTRVWWQTSLLLLTWFWCTYICRLCGFYRFDFLVRAVATMNGLG